jgi:hypothetical protein
MKVTCNPGGPGHHWVKARYHLDTHPKGMEIFRFEWVNPFTKKKVEKTRTFIPSLVTDNTYLDDSYIASLFQVGSVELVRAWLEGDWSVIQGAFFDGWSNKNIVEPFAIPKEWLRFRSIDWGTFRPFSVGWWALNGDDFPLAASSASWSRSVSSASRGLIRPVVFSRCPEGAESNSPTASGQG